MRGLLIPADNPITRSQARHRGLAVEVGGEPSIPFDRTLVASGAVPWDLVDAGFSALERWEVAAAHSKNGELAEDVGSGFDRAATLLIVLDLRVPLFSTELLFLRKCEGAERLVDEWKRQRGDGDDRLALLRAVYLTKPLLLTLPRTWLALSTTYSPAPERRRTQGNNRLIHVQIAPGRTVCCRPEEADHYREMFARMHVGRR